MVRRSRTYVSGTLNESGPVDLGKNVDNELLNKRRFYVLHLSRLDCQGVVIGHAALNIAHEHVMSQHSHDGWVEKGDWTEMKVLSLSRLSSQ